MPASHLQEVCGNEATEHLKKPPTKQRLRTGVQTEINNDSETDMLNAINAYRYTTTLLVCLGISLIF